ncbi:hypothetical protein RchiOBHm_Chr2g0147281 [Rosa chinensis]|uniref:Uncharacterized protein n=1 Tax=Rosa chinensis TaxID=74649 RepID=A0A2P6RZ57_ROSCH|nr:hypothetical protein RchiOBHm_Chr2g0147281 [Rosa chinensis]
MFLTTLQKESRPEIEVFMSKSWLAGFCISSPVSGNFPATFKL